MHFYCGRALLCVLMRTIMRVKWWKKNRNLKRKEKKIEKYLEWKIIYGILMRMLYSLFSIKFLSFIIIFYHFSYSFSYHFHNLSIFYFYSEFIFSNQPKKSKILSVFIRMRSLESFFFCFFFQAILMLRLNKFMYHNIENNFALWWKFYDYWIIIIKKINRDIPHSIKRVILFFLSL